MNFIRSEKVNRLLGLRIYKWIVTKSIFKYFNQKIKVNGKINAQFMKELREEMTFSELSHLCSFILILIISLYYMFQFKLASILMLFVLNFIFNLYPVLLQQYNNRRLVRVRFFI
jgi:hypothetical protein